jgi:hypothetical protein
MDSGNRMKIDRRRLLKGSLAAPLVLTVRPASAQAVTSAVACLKRCEINAHYENPSKITHALRSDEWMRVEFDVCRLAPSIGKPFFSGKYFLGYNRYTYWRLDDRNPYHAPAQESHHTKGSCYAEKTGQKLYGIAYVDRTGTIKGFGWDNEWHDTPVTWSCYTSAVGLKHKA